MYDYLSSMVEDIKVAFNDYSWESKGREKLAEEIHDKLWNDDSVTGNCSGSYTCNSNLAKEYVTDNSDLCQEALTEFCVEKESIAEHFLNGDYEYFDVTIRCYLLGQAIDKYLDEYYQDFSNYTVEDICDDLFNFTDAMWDNLSDEEKNTLANLRERFRELCSENYWEE